MTKSDIINCIIATEGGYVNSCNDSGGATNFGITESVARSNGYEGAMEGLKRSDAFEIYKREYWDEILGDTLFRESPAVAEEVMDTSVNLGVSRAVGFLQTSLNVLVKTAKLDVDGIMGAKTMSALRSYMNHRDDDITLCKALNCLQGAFYIQLSEKREKDKDFIYGWLRNRVNFL